jgi:hypothetical protein
MRFSAREITLRAITLRETGDSETAEMMQGLLDANLLLIGRCEELRRSVTRLESAVATLDRELDCEKLGRELHRELSEP